MKRSNRLVLLIGIFLAVVAFVGILFISQGQGGPGTGQATPTPSEVDTVFAKTDIPLGTVITQDVANTSLEVRKYSAAERGNAFSDPAQLIGKIVRSQVVAGQIIDASVFGGQAGVVTNITVPQGLRGIAIQVDQLSGVGTVIQPGDWVDVVLGITGDKFPVVTVNPQDNSIQTVAGVNGTSVKVLIQGIQVLGTLLPPPATTAQNQATPAPSSTTGGQTTALNGQQQIVIVAVTAQQAELIKYAQLDGSITLALRSPVDFRDPNDPNKAIIPPPDQTSGITLKVLTGPYGVLVPELVETVLPAQARR